MARGKVGMEGGSVVMLQVYHTVKFRSKPSSCDWPRNQGCEIREKMVGRQR